MDELTRLLLTIYFVVLSLISVESRLLTRGNKFEKDHYTSAHDSLHRLVRSTTHAHLSDFEIAVPEIVDHEGNHLTHSLRQRRSVDSATKQFRLSAHGHDFHVELIPNRRLLSPDFVVKRVRRDAATSERRETEEKSEGLDCHFTGRLLSHENRSTAISMCDGMSGLLRTGEDDFIIEPVPRHLEHEFPSPQRPHIVYKRKHLGNGKEKLHFCGKQKPHPMAVATRDDIGVRLLSDGARIIKSLDEVENEYDVPPSYDNVDSDPEFQRASGQRQRRETNTWYQKNERPDRPKRVVETLVVADQQMVKNHESDHVDVTTYILTVMNMVTSLFKDGTLDENIEIVLVGLTLIDDDQELKLDHRADKSLSNFCHWQAKANTSTGRRPDHSILLTGIDICIDKNRPCDTLGLAQIGGMCSVSDSCTINEDMGLGLAFTVAHETGHSFGMKHDSQGNSCAKRGGHIMSPTLNTLNGVFTWSACSRKSMQKFLRSDHSRCLNNVPDNLPTDDYAFPEELPGQMYSANKQCQLQFGEGTQLCYYRYQSDPKTVCKVLWCQRSNGVCETKYMPAAEGTSCGRDMWCRRGECVPRGSSGPQAVHGGWSPFGPWSDCSRSCGSGVSFRQRHCNSPSPRYGGRYCDGEEKIYQLCNTQDCPPTAIDFRSQQCAEYNSKPYRRQYFNWIPFTKYWKYDFNRCELLCEAEGYGFFDMLSSQVKDGTKCDEESNDVCIAGQCMHVGCDRRLNSNATLDACGVCNGDNSTCRFVNGSFTDNVPDSGYYRVARIPRGARSVRIWENTCCTHTYIAVRSASDPNLYFLNGNWRVDLYGETKFAGAKWEYERQMLQVELLSTYGPLEEDIIVEALIVRDNPGISFSYAIQEISNKIEYQADEAIRLVPRHAYTWHSQITPCSKSCAGGEQKSEITCLEDEKHSVNLSNCDSAQKPTQHIKKCNTHACPARWVTEDWGLCSRTCGGGVQTRRVTCKRETMKGEEYAPPNDCDLSKKPIRSQVCEEANCPAIWKSGAWSQCSRLCGRGVRTRTVTCMSGDRQLSDNKCDVRNKPHYRQSCLVSYCRRRYQWFITAWGECSVTCGVGVQQRGLKCSYKGRNGRFKPVNSRKCRHARKPRISLTKSCYKPTCPFTTTPSRPSPTSRVIPRNKLPDTRNYHHRSSHYARWIVSNWQQCTLTCGGGKQIRTVRCVSHGKPSNACPYDKKPDNMRTCNVHQCTTTPGTVKDETCEDKYKWCYLVPQHNTCSHKFFGQQCCKSCKNAMKSR